MERPETPEFSDLSLSKSKSIGARWHRTYIDGLHQMYMLMKRKLYMHKVNCATRCSSVKFSKIYWSKGWKVYSSSRKTAGVPGVSCCWRVFPFLFPGKFLFLSYFYPLGAVKICLHQPNLLEAWYGVVAWRSRLASNTHVHAHTHTYLRPLTTHRHPGECWQCAPRFSSAKSAVDGSSESILLDSSKWWRFEKTYGLKGWITKYFL